jgi:hypothetical protein
MSISVIHQAVIDNQSIGELVDIDHPIMKTRIDPENIYIFVKYLKMIKSNPESHWSLAFLMMLYEMGGLSERGVT